MRRQLAAFGLILAVVLTWNHFRTQAQTGSVQFLGAASGTTLAANCPATPATPSVCVVGGGVYIYQSSATGWFLPQPQGASSAVTSVQVCNAAGSSCATAQTGAVVLDIPKTVTVTVPSEAATVTVN